MPQDRYEEWRDVGRCFASLLVEAVKASGATRREIAARAGINKDSLRRILAGTRSPTLCEALTILGASGSAPRTAIILALIGRADRAVDWHQTAALQFMEEFAVELPCAIEAVLGERLQDVKPRWAKGAAHRTAGLLADHIDQLERQDAQNFAV